MSIEAAKTKESLDNSEITNFCTEGLNYGSRGLNTKVAFGLQVSGREVGILLSGCDTGPGYNPALPRTIVGL